ncbi:hypothetical protein [Sphingomonas lacusdianchii]|uniref:hypothetical protein n=1 Tax=Sphingomonas lacusdianchii TaxID=2917992 RepID=UPI001F5A7D9F|nr:hypothetical protein [Sphingomonas sp. JXJ CY 53]
MTRFTCEAHVAERDDVPRTTAAAIGSPTVNDEPSRTALQRSKRTLSRQIYVTL